MFQQWPINLSSCQHLQPPLPLRGRPEFPVESSVLTLLGEVFPELPSPLEGSTGPQYSISRHSILDLCHLTVWDSTT